MEADHFTSIIKEFQRNEITEHFIYQRIAKMMKKEENRKIIEQISIDEKKHYDFWKSHTNEEVKPNRFRKLFFVVLVKVFGVKKGIELLEKSEKKAQIEYAAILLNQPNIQWIIDDEISHEGKLVELIQKE